MKTHIKKCKNFCDDERTLALLTASKSTTQLPQNPIRPLLCDTPTSNPPLLSSPQNLADVQKTVPASTGRKCRTLNPIRRTQSLQDGSLASGGVRSLARTLSPSDLQDEFSADLCRLLIELNTAWAAADKPGLHRFIQKWVGPEVAIQDRRRGRGPCQHCPCFLIRLQSSQISHFLVCFVPSQ